MEKSLTVIKKGSVTKEADSVLNAWGDETRKGFRFFLGVKLSSIYPRSRGGVILEDNILNEVDHIVGAMAEEVKRVVIRYYVDPIKNKRKFYKKDTRTMEMKATTEGIYVKSFESLLRIGRYIVYSQLKAKGFI